MKLLFLHQNMPGQFKHLARHYGADPANSVVFMTRPRPVDLPGVRKIEYATTREPSQKIHHYLPRTEDALLHGQAVLRECQKLRGEGFVPDAIVAHPGWGESLFVKDIYPNAGLLHYCEWFYRARGANIGFEHPVKMDHACSVRVRNMHLLSALEACDWGYVPTEWQARQHPLPFRSKMTVVFDGIDTDAIKPNPAARFTLPGGRVLTAADEVVTYVSRNLEPFRGFARFMHAIPEICRRRPDAQIVLVGGDGFSYGGPSPDGRPWREVLLQEVAIDPARVHFVGLLSYADYLSLLQISTAHVYLTYPFVLSWSAFEALAAGCVMVGSDTAPVREVIDHGVNGFLVDFFDPMALAAQVEEALARRHDLAGMRRAARERVLERYALARCLPIQAELIARVAG